MHTGKTRRAAKKVLLVVDANSLSVFSLVGRQIFPLF